MSIILDEQDNEWVRVMPHLRTDCVEEEKVCSGLQFSSCQFHKVQASKFPLKDSIPTPFNRWEGEKLIMMFRHVAELGTQISDGSVYVTNGELAFDEDDEAEIENRLVTIRCKNLKVLQFQFCNSLEANEFERKLLAQCFDSEPFALVNRNYMISDSDPDLCNGWKLFSWEKEFQRMQVPADQWRITTINKDFSLSPTYPPCFIIPKATSDQEIQQIASFRSKGRVPALSWCHPVNGTSITRCAQPLPGFLGWGRCEADEKFMRNIMSTTKSSGLRIIDCRSKMSALANKAKSGGFESSSYYERCTIDFIGIGNIHVMRSSLNELNQINNPNPSNDTIYLSWFHHISGILQGALDMAESLELEKTSVLVHCSDGWDRTAQLSSIAQLLLDKFYRTIVGFEILIEKEWISFGHRFYDRIGHKQNNDFWDAHDRSPVFLQFLDCTYQLLVQFPECFEFNESLLSTIMDNVYGCSFGTFLHNNSKDRAEARIHESSASLWSYINHPDHVDVFRNRKFVDTDKFLQPICSPDALKLWGYYVNDPKQIPSVKPAESYANYLSKGINYLMVPEYDKYSEDEQTASANNSATTTDDDTAETESGGWSLTGYTASLFCSLKQSTSQLFNS